MRGTAPGIASVDSESLHLDQAGGADWRESFYFNLIDPARRLAAFFTIAFRPARRSGDAVLVVVRDEHVLQVWCRGAPELRRGAIALGGLVLEPVVPGRRWRARFGGEAGVFDAERFPPGPLGLLLPPRRAALEMDVEFAAATPLLDYRQALRPEWEPVLRPLGLDHVEQLGRWRGSFRLGRGGRAIEIDGRGSRDHSWGARRWLAADGWTNHAALFDDGLGVHAIRVSIGGRRMSGGFLCRGGDDVEPLAEVELEREPGPGLDFALTVIDGSGRRLALAGRRLIAARIPLVLSRRFFAHLRGRPWASVIEEGQAEYRRPDGSAGYGLDERLHNRGPEP